LVTRPDLLTNGGEKPANALAEDLAPSELLTNAGE
jgi:hypothetical protein